MASAGSVQCCLEGCKIGPITSTDGRVDVRGLKLDKKSKTDFKAKWGEDGVATMHHECWKLMQRAAKESSPEDKPFILHDLERGMVKEAMKTAEFHNSLEKVQHEANRIVDMLGKSSYCIAFTGAGISTAAGIGDFRGIHGKWTNQDKAKLNGEKKAAYKKLVLNNLRPTYTHEALVKLMEMGIIKYCISQNTDGLHRLSGIPADKISELHGNAYAEKCEKCGVWYSRDRVCRSGASNVPPKPCKNCRINHRTGGICDNKKCRGYLMNTIINFGDYLEADVLKKSINNAELSDLVLCLGTTLKVSPANSIVEMGKRPTKLIICNRQVTDCDDICLKPDSSGTEPLGSRVFGDCDLLMREVMKLILSKEELLEWEKGRETRMLEYDARRRLRV